MSPEELEAIRNGVKFENKFNSMPKGIAKITAPEHKNPHSSFVFDKDDRPVWGSSSANAQAQTQNKHGERDQTAGAISFNKNVNNENGHFQTSGSSSISSNIDENGKKGLVASSNVQKTSSHTLEGFSRQETSQSQTANFDRDTNSLLASDANTNIIHTINETGERLTQNSGSSAINQNQHGSGTSKAQVNTVEYNQNGVKGSKTDSLSQATQLNKDGTTSNSDAHAGAESSKGPDGSEVTVLKASSSNINQSQNGSSGSSSNCGSQGGQNSNTSGFSSSFSSSSSSSFSGGNGQTVSNSGCESGLKIMPGGFQPILPQIFQPNFYQNQFTGPFG